MFNEIKIIKGHRRSESKFSFVGIQRNQYTGQLEFWLPHGFDNFPDDDFESKKILFFRMYKTFRKFLNENKVFSKKYKKNDRDGTSLGSGGFIFKGKNDQELILYSKISMLDSILDGYDELKITSLLAKNAKSENIDYSKIDKYMHKAIYLIDQDNTIYLDQMVMPKKILEYSNADLVKMYCFIYLDVKRALEEDQDVVIKIKGLAEGFREKYLTPESSLFGEESYEITVNTLKEILVEIDRNSAYKDDDYWHFFDVIETFLYGTKINIDGDRGKFWGVSNFSFIWEEMCNHYVFNDLEFKDKILYADCKNYANVEIGGYNVYMQEGFENPFFFSLNSDSLNRRDLRPDLVYTGQKERKNPTDDIFKNVKIRDKYSSTLLEIEIDDLLMVECGMDKEGFREESCYFREEISKKRLVIKGMKKKKKKDRKEVLHIRRKNYESIKSEIKDRISNQIENNNSNCLFLADYKYVPIILFDRDFSKVKQQNVNEKLKPDIKKQLTYEYALQLQNKHAETKSLFCIPYYFNDHEKVGVGKFQKKLGKEIKKSKIDIFKVNFMLIQQKYIEK